MEDSLLPDSGRTSRSLRQRVNIITQSHSIHTLSRETFKMKPCRRYIRLHVQDGD